MRPEQCIQGDYCALRLASARTVFWPPAGESTPHRPEGATRAGAYRSARKLPPHRRSRVVRAISRRPGQCRRPRRCAGQTGPSFGAGQKLLFSPCVSNGVVFDRDRNRTRISLRPFRHELFLFIEVPRCVSKNTDGVLAWRQRIENGGDHERFLNPSIISRALDSLSVMEQVGCRPVIAVGRRDIEDMARGYSAPTGHQMLSGYSPVLMTVTLRLIGRSAKSSPSTSTFSLADGPVGCGTGGRVGRQGT